MAMMQAEGGRLIAAATLDGTVGVMDTATQSYVVLMRSHRDEITGLVVSHDGRRFATMSKDLTVRAWDVATMQQTYDVIFPGEEATTLRFRCA